MSERNAEYFELQPHEFELLSDEEKELVTTGQTLEDDTKVENTKAEESSDSSDADKDSDEKEDKEPEYKLLAKDNIHEIPYQELLDTRQREAEWKEFANQQSQLIADLQTAKIEDAGTGKTEAQDAVKAEYAGEFPEVASDLKPYIQSMIDDGIKSGLAQFQEEINKRVAPVEQIANESYWDKYFTSIRNAHPDADSIVDGKDLQVWIDAQPSFVRDKYVEALEYKGPAKNLIELFAKFKQDTGSDKPKEPATDVAGKAKSAIAKVKSPVPGSLSDIPAGTTGHHDEAEAVLNMSPRELERKFAGKSADEVMKMMSKYV